MQSKSFFYDNYNNYYFYLIFFKCNVIVIATDRKKITILTLKKMIVIAIQIKNALFPTLNIFLR